ncbi:MAG: hypothetical protein ACREEP_09410, partial [Dongiaceae bacterium]
MAPRAPIFTDADARDTQALVKTGFGKLRGGCYLLLRIVDLARARSWLRSLSLPSIGDIGGGKILEEAVQV